MFGNKEIHKIKDIFFMEKNGSIRNNLELHPSGRNKGPMMVEVDESSNLPLFDGNGQFVDGNE